MEKIMERCTMWVGGGHGGPYFSGMGLEDDAQCVPIPRAAPRKMSTVVGFSALSQV